MPHACVVRIIFPTLCDDLPKLGRYTSILFSLRSLSPPNVFFMAYSSWVFIIWLFTCEMNMSVAVKMSSHVFLDRCSSASSLVSNSFPFTSAPHVVIIHLFFLLRISTNGLFSDTSLSSISRFTFLISSSLFWFSASS